MKISKQKENEILTNLENLEHFEDAQAREQFEKDIAAENASLPNWEDI